MDRPGNGVAAKDVELALSAPARSSLPVTYKELSYTVTNSANKKEKLDLLKGVFGYILPGQLTALMGPSGSGKTTLLDVLAGRKTTGKVQGSILFAGHKVGAEFLRRYTAYVEQFDTLISNLTVQEMLLYTIELKVESAVPLAEKRARVESVLEQLNLGGCQGVRIGNASHRGISGGQAKRVNVGLALVSNPRVLFLDECTSGLDSYTANEVLSAVKGLLHGGISICSTIHSPTAYCFGLFDALTLLLRGRVIYCGPSGKPAMRYFEANFADVAHFHADGVHQNPAEWIVDLTTKADRDGLSGEFAAAYDASTCRSEAVWQVDLASSSNTDSVSAETLKELNVRRGTTNGFFFTLKTLLKYRVWKDLRDIEYLAPRIAEKLVFSLIVLSLYWKVGKDLRPAAVNNQVSVLFMWAVLPAYASAAYVPSIVMERNLFVRERADGLFRPIAYLSQKLVGEATVMVVISLACSALVFYTVRLAGSFVFFWLDYLMTSLCGIAVGYAVAAWAVNMEVANVVLPLYVTVLLFFTGLLIRPLDQPDYWHWFAYIDFIHYSWGGMMINQYQGTIHRDALAYDNTPVLEFYSFATSSKWEQLGWLCVFFVVFMTLAWVALAYRRLQKR